MTTPQNAGFAKQQRENAAGERRAEEEARYPLELLERIAVALEGLFILQRGHAKDCQYLSNRHDYRPCTCDYESVGGK